MKNILEYKGYHAKVEYDSEDSVLYGKIEGINDLVTFECENCLEIEKEFHAAVDDYLAFCEEVGKSPDKEYKGTFNVRISPTLHKKASILSVRQGCSLNATVEKAIERYVAEEFEKQSSANVAVEIPAQKIESTDRYENNVCSNTSNVYPFDYSQIAYGEELMN